MPAVLTPASLKGKHQMNTSGKPARRGSQDRRDKKGSGGKDHRTKPVIEPAVQSTDDMAPERIAKLLARAGIASRREAERMIEDGRIRLNGSILASPAINVTLSDRIEVDGEPLRGIERTRLWLYHKPSGLVSTHKDPEGRSTVFEKLPAELPRVLSVGRLDINTEGLLLLTNDGGLARVLELPSTGWLRRYRVRAHGKTDQAALDRLRDGIAVDGVLYGAIEATLDRTQGSNVWITMGFREGKNREIKNVLGALGLEVNRLIRISYGPFQLSDLKEGSILEVKGRTLRDQLGPRLIEAAGANFDAPVFNEQKPAPEIKKPATGKKRSEQSTDPRKAERPRGAQSGREDASDKRERNLGRLDTKKPDEKPNKFQRRNRASNVWMAPGARPVVAKEKSDPDARTSAGKPSSGAAKKGGKPMRKGGADDRAPHRKGGQGRTGNADRRR
jgi:23S rRNA pseudouridine2605 synthase